MAIIEVGQPFSPGRVTWPETTQYNYHQGGHELTFFLRRPTRREIDAIRQGRASFGVVATGDLVVLLYEFAPAIRWSDAPYSWHLVPEDQRQLPPETGPGDHALLTVYVVSADTGLVLAIRALGLGAELTAVLHQAIRVQAGRPWPGSVRYEGQIQALYRRYPQSSQMVAIASATWSTSASDGQPPEEPT